MWHFILHLIVKHYAYRETPILLARHKWFMCTVAVAKHTTFPTAASELNSQEESGCNCMYNIE